MTESIFSWMLVGTSFLCHDVDESVTFSVYLTIVVTIIVILAFALSWILIIDKESFLPLFLFNIILLLSLFLKYLLSLRIETNTSLLTISYSNMILFLSTSNRISITFDLSLKFFYLFVITPFYFAQIAWIHALLLDSVLVANLVLLLVENGIFLLHS